MQRPTGGGREASAPMKPAALLSIKKRLLQVGRKRFEQRGRTQSDQPCTRSLNILPAVKAGTFLAGMAIFSPVLGFRP